MLDVGALRASLEVIRILEELDVPFLEEMRRRQRVVVDITTSTENTWSVGRFTWMFRSSFGELFRMPV